MNFIESRYTEDTNSGGSVIPPTPIPSSIYISDKSEDGPWTDSNISWTTLGKSGGAKQI
jgi:hypothetical protein